MLSTPGFLSLRSLDLSGNPRLGGTLPALWFQRSGPMPALGHLNLSGCGLSGSLPVAWAGPSALQAIQTLDLSGNALTGEGEGRGAHDHCQRSIGRTIL